MKTKLIITGVTAVLASSLLSLSAFATAPTSGLQLCGKNLKTPLYAECGGRQFANYPIPAGTGCLSVYGMTYIPWALISQLGTVVSCELFSSRNYTFGTRVVTTTTTISTDKSGNDLGQVNGTPVNNSSYNLRISPLDHPSASVKVTVIDSSSTEK